MSRLAQGLVMMLFGGAVLRASLTSMYLRYVKESLQPFLIAAALLLIVAGIMTLWYELRRDPGPVGQDPPGHGGAGHREPLVAWLLIAPVLGLLLVAPPALGSYTASTAGTALNDPPPRADFPELPQVSLVELALFDYAARAVWDDGRTLAGRRVRVSGFLITDAAGRADGGSQEQFLARLVLSCCAADARPVKVGMAGEVPAGLADDTWVAVIGTYRDQATVDPVNEATIPYIEVETWEVIEAPDQSYE